MTTTYDLRPHPVEVCQYAPGALLEVATPDENLRPRHRAAGEGP